MGSEGMGIGIWVEVIETETETGGSVVCVSDAIEKGRSMGVSDDVD